MFLGFAFHPLNVALLTPATTIAAPEGGKKVIATTRGLSESDRNAIYKEIIDIWGVHEKDVSLYPND